MPSTDTGWKEISSILDALNRYANLDPDYARWEGDGSPPDYLYCQKCAETELNEIDGGWGTKTSDSCCHCKKCGVILDYSLTKSGVEYELDHFDIRFRKPLTRGDAFHIARVIDAAPDDPNVVRLARRAMKALPPPPIQGE